MKSLIIGSDHAGYSLKKHIVDFLESEYKDIEIIDIGCEDETKSINYPDIAQKLSKDLLDKKIDRGILVCGSGIGMSISANRFKGIRAALCHDVVGARLTREHNDSNILCLGNWFVTQKMSEQILKVWIETEFQGERHLKRIELIDSI